MDQVVNLSIILSMASTVFEQDIHRVRSTGFSRNRRCRIPPGGGTTNSCRINSQPVRDWKRGNLLGSPDTKTNSRQTVGGSLTGVIRLNRGKVMTRKPIVFRCGGYFVSNSWQK